MKVLILTHAFNSLTQRIYLELTQKGHTLSVEFDIHDTVTREAAALFKPDIILATFLKRAIPEDIWKNHRCLIVHPGPPGDRGPSALDWAILEGKTEWGVTVLQAEREMDAGPIWASSTFPMRGTTKSSLYRREVTEAAVHAVLTALDRIESGTFSPETVSGTPRPLTRQADRLINWKTDSTTTVIRKIRSADGQPGTRDTILGQDVYLYDAHPEYELTGTAGTIIAQHQGAICRATTDGAVWIGHLRPHIERNESNRNCGQTGFKLPASHVLGDALNHISEIATGYNSIRYEEIGPIGYLHFQFYNGAMSSQQCDALRDAIVTAKQRPTRILCLMGGTEFWSNGLNLNVIEASDHPAEESWKNINAMNDLVREIILMTDKITVAAMHGNAGAGGVFLALAADHIVARKGIILNPHYKNMGNLYGSEYWTYLLPNRSKAGASIMEKRLPIGTQEALSAGLIDETLDGGSFDTSLAKTIETLLQNSDVILKNKQKRREQDEAEKPLEIYRQEELERMKLNFFGFDPSYHVARYYFVHKTCHSRTPPYLAKHRDTHFQ